MRRRERRGRAEGGGRGDPEAKERSICLLRVSEGVGRCEGRGQPVLVLSVLWLLLLLRGRLNSNGGRVVVGGGDGGRRGRVRSSSISSIALRLVGC